MPWCWSSAVLGKRGLNSDHRIIKVWKDFQDHWVQLLINPTPPCPSLNHVPRCHVHVSLEHFRDDDSTTSHKQMINSESGKWICSAFSFLEAVKTPTISLSKRIHLWRAWASQLRANMTRNEIFGSWQEVKEKCFSKGGVLAGSMVGLGWGKAVVFGSEFSLWTPWFFLHGYKKIRCWLPKQLNNCT